MLTTFRQTTMLAYFKIQKLNYLIFFVCFVIANFCQTTMSIYFAILIAILYLTTRSFYNRNILTIYLLSFFYLNNRKFQSYKQLT